MKKAVIFDLDGTIVTTEEAWVKAGSDVLALHGVSLDAMQASKTLLGEQYHGATPMQWVVALGREFGIPRHQLFAQIQEAVFKRYETEVKFIKGFEPFISALEKAAMKRAIATNSDDASLEKIANTMNLKRYFGDHMYNISCVKKPKPDPDLYLHAAQAIGEDPAQCIAIEDSAIGIASAKAAGMTVIGINTAKVPEQLKQAHHVVDSYDEIMERKLVEL